MILVRNRESPADPILIPESRIGEAFSENSTYRRFAPLHCDRISDPGLDLPSRGSEDPESQLVSGERGVFWRARRTHDVSEPDRKFGPGYSSVLALGPSAAASRLDLSDAGRNQAHGGGFL